MGTFTEPNLEVGLTAMYCALGKLVALHEQERETVHMENVGVDKGLLKSNGSIRRSKKEEFAYSGELEQAIETTIGITLVARTPRSESLCAGRSIATSEVDSIDVDAVDDTYERFRNEADNWLGKQHDFVEDQMFRKEAYVGNVKSAITGLNDALDGSDAGAATEAIQRLYDLANVGNMVSVRGVYDALVALEGVAKKAVRAGFDATEAQQIAGRGKTVMKYWNLVPPTEESVGESLAPAVLARAMLYDKTKSFRE